MNSAAKLRIRTIAGLGASALLATAFGPAALAWTDATGEASTAGTASFGIIDSDDNTAGTQGAQAIPAGTTEQAIAPMRFVIPATWKTGDKLVFSINQRDGANTDIAKRMSFSGAPAVTIDSRAYAADTHIATTSTKTSQNSALAGDVEGGGEKAYTVPSGGVAPVAPEFTVSMSSSLNNPAYQDQVIVTFSNTNDTGAAAAKFIGSLNDVKINVGAAVEPGNVVVSAKALTGAAETKVFFSNGQAAAESKTVPAVVIDGSLTVANPSLIADGTSQLTGPITVTKTSGALSGTVTVQAAGNAPVEPLQIAAKDRITFDIAKQVTARQYDGSGKLLKEETITPVAATDSDSSTLGPVTVSAGATRIEFSGVAVKVPPKVPSVTYSLTAAGGITIPLTPLGGTGYSQTDIAAPASVAEVKVRPGGQGSDSRISGFDRYSTAAQLAIESLADATYTNHRQNSVVLVSGTSFADALSAGYLAKVTSSRILLTEPDALPGATSDFIRNYGVKNVYIVGGTSAVSSALEDSLRNRLVTNVTGTDTTTDDGDPAKIKKITQSESQKLNVVRISGPDRFVTNRNVNRYAYEKSNGTIGSMIPSYGQASKRTAVFVSGTTPWDALAASPMVSNNLPVVLTTPALHDQAKGQIGDFGIGYGIVVGGKNVISEAAEADLNGRGVAVTRVAGENRFATANAVNDLLLKSDMVTSATTGPQGFGFLADAEPFLVNGGVVAGAPDATKWADALAVGPIAAADQNPVLLTDSASLPAALETWLKAHTGLGAVTAVGGPDVVSNAVLAAANTILGD